MSSFTRFAQAACTLALATSLTGCYSLTYSAQSMPNDSVSMTPQSNVHVVRHFRSEQHAWFILSGLIPMFPPNLTSVLQNEAGNRHVQNLTIHSEASCLDALYSVGGATLIFLLVNTFASGNAVAASTGSALGYILTPQFRTVAIEGDVVEPDHH